MQRMFLPIFLIAGLLPAWPQESGSISFKGAQVFYEFGNIVKGVELAEDTLDNIWAQRFGGSFDIKASRGEHLSLYLGAGSIFWHAIPEIAVQSASQVFYGDAILTKAFTQFNFGDGERPAAVGKLGFFPVKYGYSRNLGEYLFRTGTYPSFLITGNGFTAVNINSQAVLGTQWTHNITNTLSHDLFITSERNTYPLHDFSISYLAKYTGGLVKLGLGIQFDRLIPVRPSSTTPSAEKNTTFIYQGRNLANNPEFYTARLAGATRLHLPADSAQAAADKALVDSLRAAWVADPASKPEMTKITFKGIKPLALAALDFKSLFGSSVFRGDEMVLYSEAVLMGIENQPVYYENRNDRIAVMAGFNLPTFGLLDNLNVEMERLTAKYVNGYRTAREGKLPLPDYYYNVIGGYHPDDWKGDDIKWSVFLGKTIMNGFQVQAQVANDHLRGRRHTRVVSENSILIDDDNWYYFIKFQASI